MSKEEILKGFRSEFSEYLRPKTIGVFDSILLANEFEEYLTKAIDQTREETIREVEEVLPEENHKEENAGTDWSNSGDVHSLGFEIGYNEAVKEIKQSLINLRSK